MLLPAYRCVDAVAGRYVMFLFAARARYDWCVALFLLEVHYLLLYPFLYAMLPAGAACVARYRVIICTYSALPVLPCLLPLRCRCRCAMPC